MGSEKALYWITLGVLALFVSNNFATRHEQEVRCLASQAMAAVEQVSSHSTQLIAMAESMLGQGDRRFVRAQTAMAGAQTRLASVQTVIACREAAFARVRAEHARFATMQELRSTVVCPRQNLRMVIPEPSSIRTDGTI
jgi:hypothetical protein